MSGSELPDAVRRLVHDCVPTLEALEILLLVARDPGHEWRAQDIMRVLRPSRVGDADVDQYLRLLASHGVLQQQPSGTYLFEPAAATQQAVEGLIVAYHQRPVTLVRTIYEGAELKGIRSFADAFRLRRKD